MPSRTRWLLAGSLCGLLALVTVTGTVSLLVFSGIQRGETALRQRFSERRALLEQIRAGVYLSGTLARDYWADPAGPDAPALQARLASLERETRQALVRVGAPQTLRGEVIAWWKVLNFMSEMAAQRRTPGLDAYFRNQLAQRRETMLQIAARIGVSIENEVAQGSVELARMYSRLRMTLGAGLTLIAALGLAIAFLAARKVMRLEAQARALSAEVVRAQEEERRSLARELHDEIGQALSRILLDLGNARIGSAAALAEQTVDSVRRIALALRPSMLDDLGLVAALEWQAREVMRRGDLEIAIDAEDRDYSEPQRICIYRVAQEALQNCVRHARAKHVRLSLRTSAKSTTLQIGDDGVGFSTRRKRGLGLLGMEERVVQLGGRFHIHSEPGRGTVITAELPA